MQHPFVTGEIGISDHVTHSPVMVGIVGPDSVL
jgi:hypothetical protein